MYRIHVQNTCAACFTLDEALVFDNTGVCIGLMANTYLASIGSFVLDIGPSCSVSESDNKKLLHDAIQTVLYAQMRKACSGSSTSAV